VASPIERRHDPRFLLVINTDAAIGGLIPPENLGRRVRRPVVDDHELQVGERLPQNAVDRMFQVDSAVVYGHHNADAWGLRHASSREP